MNVREYLSIRRAYNTVRQEVEARRRLTFFEFALLCRLSRAGKDMRTSELAEYQGCLRPTMTHRTKHLHVLGLLERSHGSCDRRTVMCRLSKAGNVAVFELCDRMRKAYERRQCSAPMSAERICCAVDVMGAVDHMARDLIILALADKKTLSCGIGELVEELGFLQPTVSMTVAALIREGLVARVTAVSGIPAISGRRQARDLPSQVQLTEAGEHQAECSMARVGSLHVACCI